MIFYNDTLKITVSLKLSKPIYYSCHFISVKVPYTATVSVAILNTIIFAEENNPVRQYDSKLPCRIRGSEDEVSKVLVQYKTQNEYRIIYSMSC